MPQMGTVMGGVAIAGMVLSSILLLIFHYGAAKLSYDKFGSIGWAILDFLFPYIYYPYYALFVSTSAPPPAPMFGGRSRRR